MLFRSLAETVNTIERLALDRLAPAEVQRDDTVGTSQIQPDATTFEGHKHDSGLVFGHEDAHGDVALRPVHVALVFDMTKAVLGQVVGDQGETLRPLGDDKSLVFP